jgi:sugar fermentation stimulation protein A
MSPVTIGVEGPLECTVIRRLNRFVVEVAVDDSPERAWINNTGRLEGFLVEGKTGFCTRNAHRLKTALRLFAIREGALGAVIDTQLQMKAFEKALAAGLIPWLDGCVLLKRNVKLGSSVIDYALTCSGKRGYLEVKSAVLREGRYALYPDCPSARGRRHVRELTGVKSLGEAATILFIAALPSVSAFKPNRAGDPDLSDLLTEASKAGVDVKAIALFYDPRDSLVYLYDADLPVEL